MSSALTATPDSRETTRRLLEYCRANDWAGHDPYDALNSEWLRTFPILNSRFPRIAMTQLLKRSPVDIRWLLRIPKTQNPKALGLFLSSAVKLQGASIVDDSELSAYFIDRLTILRSHDSEQWCWGYSFPWQTRTQIVPRGTPNLVCTTFVATAFLDVYEAHGDPHCLEIALSAAEYILRNLYWSEGADVAGFSYPLPTMRQQIHNANLLAAALFCRVGHLTGETKFLEPALRAARFSASKQREDGSWAYGEMPTQGWVDNFHTGYNLCALRDMGRYTHSDEFESRVHRGFEFYRNHFFRDDGAPRYFHDRTYPIDVHCVAQSIITLVAFRDLHEDNMKLVQSVLQWSMNHMWDERGYFYYRKLRWATIRTSYMRWAEAWMLLALSTLLEETRTIEAPAANSLAGMSGKN
jgi:hypothetical protein